MHNYKLKIPTYVDGVYGFYEKDFVTIEDCLHHIKQILNKEIIISDCLEEVNMLINKQLHYDIQAKLASNVELLDVQNCLIQTYETLFAVDTMFARYVTMVTLNTKEFYEKYLEAFKSR